MQWLRVRAAVEGRGVDCLTADLGANWARQVRMEMNEMVCMSRMSHAHQHGELAWPAGSLMGGQVLRLQVLGGLVAVEGKGDCGKPAWHLLFDAQTCYCPVRVGHAGNGLRWCPGHGHHTGPEQREEGVHVQDERLHVCHGQRLVTGRHAGTGWEDGHNRGHRTGPG